MHLAHSKNYPTDTILESDIDMVNQNIHGCSQKYFASVFNGQREWILKAIEKFSQMNLEIKVLAPSHGPVYTDNAEQTIRKWASWSKGNYTKTVVVPYGSMYGFTAKLLNAIGEGVKEAGGTLLSFNLSEDTAVDALTALVEAPALIVGSSTYEHEIFPKVVDFLNLLKTKKFSNRCASAFGTFGWSGEATRKISDELTTLGFEVVEQPLSVFGSPDRRGPQKSKTDGQSSGGKGFFQIWHSLKKTYAPPNSW